MLAAIDETYWRQDAELFLIDDPEYGLWYKAVEENTHGNEEGRSSQAADTKE